MNDETHPNGETDSGDVDASPTSTKSSKAGSASTNTAKAKAKTKAKSKPKSKSTAKPAQGDDDSGSISVDDSQKEKKVDAEIEVDIDSAHGDDVFEDEGVELEEAENVDIAVLKPILEGAILAAGEPLSLVRMQSLFEKGQIPSKDHLRETLGLIRDDCEHRGFELCEVASGWRFQVRNTYAPWVNRLWDEKPQKYSRALLETLALIAYRQPITRGDIEEVRGVAVSSHIIKTLAERDWVKVVGHRDVPGRPALYATTKQFLDYFNLKSMDELPTLGELKDIDSLNQSLEFESAIEKLNDDANIVANPEKDPDLEKEDAGLETLESSGFAQESVDSLGDDPVGDGVEPIELLNMNGQESVHEKIRDLDESDEEGINKENGEHLELAGIQTPPAEAGGAMDGNVLEKSQPNEDVPRLNSNSADSNAESTDISDDELSCEQQNEDHIKAGSE